MSNYSGAGGGEEIKPVLGAFLLILMQKFVILNILEKLYGHPMVNSKGKLLTLTLTLKRLSVQSSRQLLQYSWQLLGVPVNMYFDKK